MGCLVFVFSQALTASTVPCSAFHCSSLWPKSSLYRPGWCHSTNEDIEAQRNQKCPSHSASSKTSILISHSHSEFVFLYFQSREIRMSPPCCMVCPVVPSCLPVLWPLDRRKLLLCTGQALCSLWGSLHQNTL